MRSRRDLLKGQIANDRVVRIGLQNQAESLVDSKSHSHQLLDRMIRQSLRHPDNLRAVLGQAVPDLPAISTAREPICWSENSRSVTGGIERPMCRSPTARSGATIRSPTGNNSATH